MKSKLRVCSRLHLKVHDRLCSVGGSSGCAVAEVTLPFSFAHGHQSRKCVEKACAFSCASLLWCLQCWCE